MKRLATIEIDKEYLHFSSAHFTIFSPNERERLHGHNFQVAAKITSPVDNNGLCFPYQIIKNILRTQCEQLDEYTLIAENSPHLKIEETESQYHVTFADELMHFLKSDVKLLPVLNITIEELAHLLLENVLAEMDTMQIVKLEIKVSSGPRQWGSCSWESTE